MKTNLLEPVSTQETSRDSLPADALKHCAWCDPSECCLTPAVTPLDAPPAMFHRTIFNGSYAGENFTATITQYIEADASEQKPIIVLIPAEKSDLTGIIPELMDQWNTLDPLTFITKHRAARKKTRQG
ncbi:hypothetical protein [Varibaculum cambriense]|uniref:hypothetical protein n=1 Tax=Varibaculum cambriense TaxID=184870 RepID=UPI00258940C2|nr:hypothetical protein [Varibaculum cambriense]MDU1224791.1 hypothetical protein [Varibaculum cambriense]